MADRLLVLRRVIGSLTQATRNLQACRYRGQVRHPILVMVAAAFRKCKGCDWLTCRRRPESAAIPSFALSRNKCAICRAGVTNYSFLSRLCEYYFCLCYFACPTSKQFSACSMSLPSMLFVNEPDPTPHHVGVGHWCLGRLILIPFNLIGS